MYWRSPDPAPRRESIDSWTVTLRIVGGSSTTIGAILKVMTGAAAYKGRAVVRLADPPTARRDLIRLRDQADA
jgi:hypothetical protein